MVWTVNVRRKLPELSDAAQRHARDNREVWKGDSDLINDVCDIFDLDEDQVEKILGVPNLVAWWQNRLEPDVLNFEPILNDDNRALLQSLLGPHGDTIMKAIKARRGPSWEVL